MSGTTTTTTGTKAEPSRQGQIIISLTAYGTFLTALVAAAYLYWVTKNDVVLAILSTTIGVAGTNATNIIGYWVGSSVGSDKKTDMLAAATPPVAPLSPTPSVVHTETVTTATPVPTPIPTPSPTPSPLP